MELYSWVGAFIWAEGQRGIVSSLLQLSIVPVVITD